MKIKKYVILIIVGICILYAIFNSVIVDLIMKNSKQAALKLGYLLNQLGKLLTHFLIITFHINQKNILVLFLEKQDLKLKIVSV